MLARSEVKNVMKKLIVLYGSLVVLGAAVFVTVVLGMLAAKGKLNAEGLAPLAEAPLVGRLVPEPAPVEKDPDAEGVTGLRPFSSQEIAELMESLRTQETEYRSRIARLEERERHLKLLRDDVEAEKSVIDEQRVYLTDRSQELAERERALREELILVDRREEGALKKMASAYQAMDAANAAEVFKTLESETAVKLLSYMQERNVAKILENVDPQLAAQLTDRVKNVKVTQEEQQ
jgi:flagellar motility protein MotE (MotC chaperone)